MLVMTFPELVGKIGEDGWKYGKVHVIMSDDNGETWTHVRDLSEEFGNIDINESSFMRIDDQFLVTTRGYDGQERMHLTNDEFKLIKQVNLTEEYTCVNKVIGRPRLFQKGRCSIPVGGGIIQNHIAWFCTKLNRKNYNCRHTLFLINAREMLTTPKLSLSGKMARRFSI